MSTARSATGKSKEGLGMKRNRTVSIALACLMLAGIILSAGCSTSAPSQVNRHAAATMAPAAGPEVLPNEPLYDAKTGEKISYGKDGLRYSAKGNPDTSGEEYEEIGEIGFRSPVRRPLSTFSVDPDSAAYSNIRRMLTDGSPVPTDAVRIEELINYFRYSYPQPKGEDPFSVTTEYADCPWNGDHKLMLVGIQAEEIDSEELPPANLVFLLDVSGSMDEPNKLPLVKRAFRMLAERLSENDTVSIVTYASGVNVVMEGVKGTKKSRVMRAIEDLEAGGSTAGASGLETAYDVAWDHFIEGGNNRVILATDGDFNVGPSSDEEMVRLIEKQRKTGIFLSIMGFGMGNLKDSKMEGMAKNGNGNYAYIDGVQQARKVMVQELGGTLVTVAKDVKIQVEFNPSEVKGYRLIGYENNMLADEDFEDDRVDAGEIGAGHRATALYEIIPADSKEDVKGSELKYQATDNTANGELCTVSIRYKQPDGSKSNLMTVPVKREAYTKEPSGNLRFASAVAEFGLLLRGSKYKGDASWESVIDRAEGAADDDLKEEFVWLAEIAKDIE